MMETYHLTGKGKEPRVIHFSKIGDASITRCPNGLEAYVGSCGCLVCQYNIFTNYKEQEVKCAGS